MGKPTLYRIYNKAGELLYVGATINPAARLRTHSHTQPWWSEAANITLEQFDTHEELAAAESTAIETEDTKYNVSLTQPFTWAWKPRRPKGDGSIYLRKDGLWVGRVELPCGPDGKRRQKTVSSKDRATAMRKFEELKAAVRDGKTH